jgi:hypothetical protein
MRQFEQIIIFVTVCLSFLVPPLIRAEDTRPAPTLDDFWEGHAVWVEEIHDVGLPVGESDTIRIEDDLFWSYLHASYESAAIIDQCGIPVAFPGCMTRWESNDGGKSFTLPVRVCAIPCQRCPCEDQRDHVGLTPEGHNAAAQQYPRVFVTEDTFHLAYEWHAQVILRTSPDGLNWSDWVYLSNPGGTWPSSIFPCSEVERIGPHPNIRGEIHDCLVGAPPGVYVEDDTLYVFVAAGSAPGNMRCYRGNRHGNLDDLRVCETDPLFSGAEEYGPVDVLGADANPYFDFRYVSSADVIRVGDRYYMAYEGVRGPEELEIGMDTQFGLGFARSVDAQIDGTWEKYPGNPVIVDMGFNWGIGHADVLVIDSVTYMYTATSQTTRGRYMLVWVNEVESD